MKFLSYFSSISLLVLMIGCLEPNCCDLPDSHQFFVNLQTSDGSNLLSNQSTDVIDLSKTRLYLIENGIPKMFKFESGGVLNDPYGVAPVSINGKLTVKFSFLHENEKEIEGIIQWNDVLADTLSFTFNSTESLTFLTNISQRGTVLWDVATNPNEEIMIVLEH
jgi:hypothetical protein